MALSMAASNLTLLLKADTEISRKVSCVYNCSNQGKGKNYSL
jgi:hypothetical protein